MVTPLAFAAKIPDVPKNPEGVEAAGSPTILTKAEPVRRGILRRVPGEPIPLVTEFIAAPHPDFIVHHTSLLFLIKVFLRPSVLNSIKTYQLTLQLL